MAVYTEVAYEDLVAFLERYDLGELHAFKGIAEGVENTNYLLHTENGQYILTLYEKRTRAEELPFFLDLMTHLARGGIPCPLPVADKEGECLQTLNGRPAAIVTFLDGVSVRNPRPAHCRAVGRALAQMHVAGQDFPGRRENSLALSAWPALLDKCGPAIEDIRPGLGALISAELAYLADHWPQKTDLPRGIIHADLFPDNVLFLGETVSGLIDFYFACEDFLAYDLAICLNAWCFERDGAFNITKARALLKGYEAVRPLTDRGMAALPILARGAALRFLLTRSHDWIHHDQNALVRPKDPLEYLRKLTFHQSVRDVSAYGLETMA